MVYYNLSNFTNASSILGLAQASNSIFGGYVFGYFTLVIVFFVIFLILKQQGYVGSACFAVSCWVITLLAMLLKPMDLIDSYGFWCTMILTSISAVTLYWTGTQD